MNNQLLKSSFFTHLDNGSTDPHELVDTSSLYRDVILPNSYDFSGMKYNNGSDLVILNYAKVGNIQIKKDVLEVYLFGNNMRITFDPYWEYSQIGYVGVREYGREVFTQKFKETGYDLSPSALLELIHKKNIKKVVFKGGEPAVNIDYIKDFIDLLLDRDDLNIVNEVNQNLVQIIIETNGSLSEEVIQAISEYKNIFFKVWIYSADNDFYKKHTKRSIEHLEEFLNILNKFNCNYSYLTTFLSGENDSEKQIERLATFLKIHTKDPAIQIRKFSPTFRVLDKAANTSKELTTYANTLTKNDIKVIG